MNAPTYGKPFIQLQYRNNIFFNNQYSKKILFSRTQTLTL